MNVIIILAIASVTFVLALLVASRAVIVETCKCGASFRSRDQAQAEEQAVRWRMTHSCG